MALADKLRKICLSLGKNNKPTYAVIAIASVKGICRPMFTMMDKTEKPETKKYTALREGLTEIIAIPVYWASGELAGSCSKFLTRNIKKEGAVSYPLLQFMLFAQYTDQISEYAVRRLFDLRFVLYN